MTDIHRVLIGTDTITGGTAAGVPNFLKVCSFKVPSPTADIESLYYDSTQVFGGIGAAPHKHYCTMAVERSIRHDTEVNNARVCPHQPELIASRGSDALVRMFLVSNQPQTEALIATRYTPDAILTGLEGADGFPLEWHPSTQGLLFAGDAAGWVAWWDVSTLQSCGPLSRVRLCEQDINGISVTDEGVAVARNDGMWSMVDTASGKEVLSGGGGISQGGAINSVSLNPHTPTRLATARADGSVSLWDLRAPATALQTIRWHQDEVFHLSWSPFHANVLATGAVDRRVCLWDLEAGAAPERWEDRPADVPKELLFVHAGHTADISGVSWSPSVPWLLSTAAEDNSLMLWSPSSEAVGHLGPAAAAADAVKGESKDETME